MKTHSLLVWVATTALRDKGPLFKEFTVFIFLAAFFTPNKYVHILAMFRYRCSSALLA